MGTSINPLTATGHFLPIEVYSGMAGLCQKLIIDNAQPLAAAC